MPNPCYSYPVNVPSDRTSRDASQAARRDLRKMPYPCYSYPIMCFSYPDDMPSGGNPGVAGSAPPGLRQMPGSICFRY
jgi:hypothetical protein